jgi:hypothetical protein
MNKEQLAQGNTAAIDQDVIAQAIALSGVMDARDEALPSTYDMFASNLTDYLEVTTTDGTVLRPDRFEGHHFLETYIRAATDVATRHNFFVTSTGYKVAFPREIPQLVESGEFTEVVNPVTKAVTKKAVMVEAKDEQGNTIMVEDWVVIMTVALDKCSGTFDLDEMHEKMNKGYSQYVGNIDNWKQYLVRNKGGRKQQKSVNLGAVASRYKVVVNVAPTQTIAAEPGAPTSAPASDLI